MRKAFYFHGNPFKFFWTKNYCPYCGCLLTLRTNHRIVNSKSEEAVKYRSLFEDSDGGALLGDFDSDITHKVFYCGKCNTEIESKTLFSYQEVVKQLSKISKEAKKRRLILKFTFFLLVKL